MFSGIGFCFVLFCFGGVFKFGFLLNFFGFKSLKFQGLVRGRVGTLNLVKLFCGEERGRFG